MNFSNLTDKEILKIFDSDYFEELPEDTTPEELYKLKISYKLKDQKGFYLINFGYYRLSISKDFLIKIFISKSNNYDDGFIINEHDKKDFDQFKYKKKLSSGEWNEVNQKQLCELIRYMDRIKNLHLFY
jgi:hypothetical protein